MIDIHLFLAFYSLHPRILDHYNRISVTIKAHPAPLATGLLRVKEHSLTVLPSAPLAHPFSRRELPLSMLLAITPSSGIRPAVCQDQKAIAMLFVVVK